ncbi:MAG: hypothetical protein R8G34_05495 [Paracoccaceae bacterium]|nr:hypothetical protein [Paracoccaceae bacterium]
MSAPDTNLATQKRKHRPVLWGVWLGVFLALIASAVVAFLMNSGAEDVAIASLPHLI